jgi:V8-like Glu-specific endopeptidase
MCKLFYRRSGLPYVASAWIVLGNTGRKGILTAGHVVYLNGVWSKDYVVCREYTGGLWIEQFRGNFARTLNGWIHGQGVREFWDLGAVIPFTPVPHTTPALPVTFGYNPQIAPFNFFYDVGYPAKPANGYPFDGQFQWESDGPLITVHHHNDQFVLQAYNAMEHGSSGSPWMIYDAIHNIHYAAGIQSSGWDGIPSSYSPYFDQRNIVPLLRDIDVLE